MLKRGVGYEQILGCALLITGSCNLLNKDGSTPLDLDPSPQVQKGSVPTHPKSKAVRLPGGMLLTVVETTKPAVNNPDYSVDPYCVEHAEPIDIYTGPQGAIVHVVNDARPNTLNAPKTAQLNIRNCAFEKLVTMVSTGASISLQNHDDTMHVVEALDEKERQLFRIAQPPGAGAVQKKLSEAVRRVQLRCQTHPWEKAWVVVVDDTGYTKRADAMGKVHFQALPPGPYDIEVWQPGFEEARLVADVHSSETIKLNMSIKP